MKINITERLFLLREEMKNRKIDYYLIRTSDYHNSEYVGEYFKVREFFSGFTGSNGTLVVSINFAGLWTDGRYFIQAEKELEGSEIIVFRLGERDVPSIPEYLAKHMTDNQKLGFDGKVCSEKYIECIKEKCKKIKIQYCYKEDLASIVWKDRPVLEHKKIMILHKKYHGKEFKEKLQWIRDKMKEENADYFFLSKLDDIMWLYNIRGNDVECNPVAMSYTFITQKESYLFVQKEAIDELLVDYAKLNNITLLYYDSIFTFLDNYSYDGQVLLDDLETSYYACQTISEKTEVITCPNPTELLKAVKNEKEVEKMHEYFILDSVAVCKFLYWIKNTSDIDEMKAAQYLDNLREQVKDYMGLSFQTIAAYKENAAMMHYEASETSNKMIEKEGFLLVDSGGQYLGATTDVTRTICMGELSDEEKKYFSLVLVGMLQLMNANFLYGCTGRNLDILARQPLWDESVDYKCGTGHGVGFYLNVHEGPQSIRWKYLQDVMETVLEEGMTITDEPGVYFEGQFGIRTENVLLVKKGIENGDGQFMYFEPLTFVPIDLEAIDKTYMSDKDIRRLNEYHQMVFHKIAPYLDEDEKKWLVNATIAI